MQQQKFEIPADWLVCPVTKAALTSQTHSFSSPAGHYRYCEPGYWDFFPQKSELIDSNEWRIWEKLQANGEVSYQADPKNNLGVGEREDFRQFAEFCQFNGRVLDVGVGPQRVPTHLRYVNQAVNFIGIDPLIGQQPRDFTFVRGLGEYLPFRDNLFDQVLFVTSLDHFIDPKVPLREAQRVISKQGSIYIWLGEKDPNAPKPTVSHAWYESLEVPAGAQDRFHYKRFNSQDFEGFLQALDLKIMAKEVLKIDDWRKNLFYRVSK